MLDQEQYESRASAEPIAFSTDAQGRRRLNLIVQTFGSRAQLAPGIFETVARGAFDETLAQDDIRLTYNHVPSQLLARNTARTLQLSADPIALRAQAVLPDTTLGHDVAELVARGDLSGASFRFMTPPEAEEWSLLPDGSELRTLKKLRLVDVTVGTYPAYPDTAVALRTRPAGLDETIVTIPIRILRAHRLYKLTQEYDRPRGAAPKEEDA